MCVHIHIHIYTSRHGAPEAAGLAAHKSPTSQGLPIYIYIYIYVYMYTYIHTYIHIYIYIHTYIHIHTHIHIYIYMYIPCVCGGVDPFVLLTRELAASP